MGREGIQRWLKIVPSNWLEDEYLRKLFLSSIGTYPTRDLAEYIHELVAQQKNEFNVDERICTDFLNRLQKKLLNEEDEKAKCALAEYICQLWRDEVPRSCVREYLRAVENASVFLEHRTPPPYDFEGKRLELQKTIADILTAAKSSAGNDKTDQSSL